MWFKNIQVFRLTAPWAITADELHGQLSRVKFAECASSEVQSQGWASPRGNDLLVHSVNKQFLLCLATEKKLLPSSVINQVTKARALEIEEEQGFAPGRKAIKDIKERVTEELLPRAFTVKTTTMVWIDPVNRWLVVDSSSASKADEVIKLLLKCCDKLPLEGLRTKSSPQAAMTGWLAGNEAPKGFSIDQDTVLQAHTQDKATVKYVRHSLDADQVASHIATGKQATSLALTWDSKISFVLTDTLAIKRIKPLDVLAEGKETASNQDERFDADFVLMTAELAKMLDDLVFALGGDLDGEASKPHAQNNQSSEQAIKLTANLYDARSTVKTLLGETYSARMTELAGLIKKEQKKRGSGVIETATAMANQLTSAHLAIQLLAAAVEMTEPSDKQQTTALSLDDHIAGQLARRGMTKQDQNYDETSNDPLYDEAVRIVLQEKRASISLVQRHLRIGYIRAARLIELMELQKVVSPMDRNGNREIYTRVA